MMGIETMKNVSPKTVDRTPKSLRASRTRFCGLKKK